MHKARALSTKMNSYMVDDHCYSFAWIKRSWTFGDSYFSFQKRMYLQLSPHCPKMNKKINVGISKKIQDFSPGLATKARETMVAKGRDTIYFSILWCAHFTTLKFPYFATILFFESL